MKIIIKNTLLIIVLIITGFLLVACGSGTKGPSVVRPNNDINKRNGIDLYNQQNYFTATDWLMKAWAKDPNDTEVYVALLDTWLQLGEMTQVWKLLNEGGVQTAEVKLIEAEVAEANQQCEPAIGLTQNIDPKLLSVLWQKRFWTLQANCLIATRAYIKATVALVRQEAYITDAFELQSLYNRIVENLIQVNEETLIFAIGDPVYDEVTTGWLEAAYVNFGADGVSGSDWLLQWPNHPAASYFLDLNQVNNQQKVAVLLPFSGRFASVAKAVQKGMLTASMADTENQYELVFYDTGSQGENLSSAWYSAQENRADLIIGPLDKSSISTVEQMPAPSIPVVLLNQSDDSDSYFQFTLSPEGEAQQVAERMIKDGRKRVLIMASNEPWGERMTQAFAQKLFDLGGQVINNSYFQLEQNDYSAQLRQTLGLVESQLRAKNLQSFLKINLSSEEVVRSDIDAIFLAARPDFARLMVPQLKFHHAANVPVYSTSHVFDGLNNEQHNRDLDGLRFALSPIELEASDLLEVLPFDLNRVGGDKKLFALGYDAYQLIARLEWMSRVNTGLIDGLSGKVNLGRDGQFSRGLVWAQYNNGSIVALPQ